MVSLGEVSGRNRLLSGLLTMVHLTAPPRAFGVQPAALRRALLKVLPDFLFVRCAPRSLQIIGARPKRDV